MKEKDVMNKMEELKDRAIDEEKLEDVAGGSNMFEELSKNSFVDMTKLPNSKDYRGDFKRVKRK